MMKQNFIFGIISLLFLANSFAQETVKPKVKNKRPPIDPNKMVELNYGNPAWNLKAGEVDSAVIILKDATSKRVVLINLQEIGPDENIFKGVFSVSWGSSNNLTPVIYVPNQTDVASRSGKEKILKQIQNGELKRKPFLLTRGDRGQQVIEVFDSTEQAKSALASLKKKLKIERSNIPENFAKKEDIALSRKAEIEAEKQERELENNKAEAERVRLQQIEARKLEERRNKEKALAAAEKLKRKQRAKKLVEEAISHFTAGEFQQAKEKFELSIDLDPENTNYYYAYAISLYRLDDFNKAIVVFQNVDKNSVDPIELKYYLGMSFFRSKDFANAHTNFKEVIQSQKEPLSSSASFYEGLCYFAEKKWEDSKNSFQWVLDNSSDPRLDEQAEDYIEQIARQQYFENNQAKKHILTAGLGLQYDSNVLLQADNSTNATASDKADIRSSITAGYQWRPLYDEVNEFSVKSSFYYLRSGKAENETADPILFQISAPYSIKGKKWDKAYKSDIIPKLEQLYMFPDSNSNRKNILDTYGVDWKNTFINDEAHFTSYNFSLTQNNSHSSISSEDQNSDALKFDFYYSNTWFVDKKKTKGWVADAGFSLYNAKGTDQKYNRIDIAGTYLAPLNWKNFVSVTRLNVYLTNYPSHSESRKDTYMSLSFNAQKAIHKNLNLILGANYTKNNSNSDGKSYTKYGINSMITGRWEY